LLFVLLALAGLTVGKAWGGRYQDDRGSTGAGR
jgi:hypothetical protein